MTLGSLVLLKEEIYTQQHYIVIMMHDITCCLLTLGVSYRGANRISGGKHDRYFDSHISTIVLFASNSPVWMLLVFSCSIHMPSVNGLSLYHRGIMFVGGYRRAG